MNSRLTLMNLFITAKPANQPRTGMEQAQVVVKSQQGITGKEGNLGDSGRPLEVQENPQNKAGLLD